MVPCDCCRKEKPDTGPTRLPHSRKVFNICEDCMRDMANPDSAAHHSGQVIVGDDGSGNQTVSGHGVLLLAE